ncbi:OLC1v1016013C1 [Oldenlandia corymbosa var. corymbosa]|uniref:OLC1v1016013C1 n=1 Tax=Oldenlandia corymbosa var. corymbosa TaxID=529605 RepID=A0AAV1E4R0_OLDCO|nr:OLC1v1016013C1 [Oldenlandia corymbosa var. corymbosa]
MWEEKKWNQHSVAPSWKRRKKQAKRRNEIGNGMVTRKNELGGKRSKCCRSNRREPRRNAAKNLNSHLVYTRHGEPQEMWSSSIGVYPTKIKISFGRLLTMILEHLE